MRLNMSVIFFRVRAILIRNRQIETIARYILIKTFHKEAKSLMKFIILLFVLLMSYGTAFADIKPVTSFSDREPEPFKSNPYGLVYADAITENVTGKVNIHPIT